MSYKQQIFTLKFEVDMLQASLFKSAGSTENALGSVTLRQFGLDLKKAEFNMKVLVKLKSDLQAIFCLSLMRLTCRSLSVEILQSSDHPLMLLSSDSGDSPLDTDLMAVTYVNAQRGSSEFTTTFNSIDQEVAILMTTVLFRVSPEPLIAVYDFIMSAF